MFILFILALLNVIALLKHRETVKHMEFLPEALGGTFSEIKYCYQQGAWEIGYGIFGALFQIHSDSDIC